MGWGFGSMAANTTDLESDLEREERVQKVRLLRRRGNLAAVRDHVLFWGSMICGAPAFIIGGIEYLEPNLLDIVSDGKLVGAIGLGLLAGPKVVSRAVQIAKTISDV